MQYQRYSCDKQYLLERSSGSKTGTTTPLLPEKNLNNHISTLLTLRGFLAYEKGKFYTQVPENKILPYFTSLSQLLKEWTYEL